MAQYCGVSDVFSKVCTFCNENLLLINFYKNKTSKDGLCCHCKKCMLIKREKWGDKNKDKLSNNRKKYLKKLKSDKERYNNCKNNRKKYIKEYCKKEYVKNNNNIFYIKNRDKIILKRKEYYIKNK